jgi:tRNA(Ile)-lysidine synthase
MAEWAPPCVRPFLGVRRSRIEETAARQGWPWREDASNLQGKYTRNRIRRELLPLAREIVPGADESLARFASLCRDDDEFLSVLAHEAFDRMASAEPEGVRLPVPALKALARPILRRVLFAACRFVGGATERLSAEHIELVEGLLEDMAGRAHRRAPVPPGTLFIRSFDDLWVMVPHALEPPPLPILGANAGVGQAPPDALVVGLAPDRPRGEIFFRHRRPGDRLPEEMGAEKIKDLLMEARIPRWRRDWAVLAEDSCGILGIFAPGRAWGPPEAGKNLWVRANWWSSPAPEPTKGRLS